jgi:hypothetical protein
MMVAVVESVASNAPATTIAHVSLFMTLLLAGPQAMARLNEARLFAAMQHEGVKACDRRQHWSVMDLTFARAEGDITHQARDPRGAPPGTAQRAQ